MTLVLEKHHFEFKTLEVRLRNDFNLWLKRAHCLGVLVFNVKVCPYDLNIKTKDIIFSCHAGNCMIYFFGY